MPFEKRLASLYQMRVSTEWPSEQDMFMVSTAEPKGQTVSKHRADQRRDEQRV
jgi:hypothetical protein